MSAVTVSPADLGGDLRRPARTGERRGRAAGQTPQLRLTGRGRVVLVVAALVLAGVWTGLGPGAHAGSGAPGIEVTAVTVATGQTLWQIARSVAAPGQDVRDVVDELVVLNGLDGVALQAGQQLLVPVATE
ncbi:MAG TPA: LysM peptidoglycan-binding domain-containing protein [Actinotalea sp.]|nr:LysM peptidoglycan-binding domain-containing protein [Actinotalea sp.]